MTIEEIFENAVKLISEEVRAIYKLSISDAESKRIRKSIILKQPSINCYYPVNSLLDEEEKDKMKKILSDKGIKIIEWSMNEFLFETKEEATEALELYYKMLTEKALQGKILFDYFFAIMSKREGKIDLENSELEFFFLRNGTHMRSAIVQMNKTEDFPILNYEKSDYWKS